MQQFSEKPSRQGCAIWEIECVPLLPNWRRACAFVLRHRVYATIWHNIFATPSIAYARHPYPASRLEQSVRAALDPLPSSKHVLPPVARARALTYCLVNFLSNQSPSVGGTAQSKEEASEKVAPSPNPTDSNGQKGVFQGGSRLWLMLAHNGNRANFSKTTPSERLFRSSSNVTVQD